MWMTALYHPHKELHSEKYEITYLKVLIGSENCLYTVCLVSSFFCCLPLVSESETENWKADTWDNQKTIYLSIMSPVDVESLI